MSAAEIAVHGGRGRRPSQRSRLAGTRAAGYPVRRLVSFAALACYGVLRWATLESPAPTGRLLALLVLAVVVAGAGPLLDRRSRPLAIVGLVLGFVAMMLLNSLDVIPHPEKAWLVQTTTFLLTIALAAMGLETDVGKLRAKGGKPLLVGAGSWLFISAFSLVLVELVYA